MSSMNAKRFFIVFHGALAYHSLPLIRIKVCFVFFNLLPQFLRHEIWLLQLVAPARDMLSDKKCPLTKVFLKNNGIETSPKTDPINWLLPHFFPPGFSTMCQAGDSRHKKFGALLRTIKDEGLAYLLICFGIVLLCFVDALQHACFQWYFSLAKVFMMGVANSRYSSCQHNTSHTASPVSLAK